jgi:hypothetical protein
MQIDRNERLGEEIENTPHIIKCCYRGGAKGTYFLIV